MAENFRDTACEDARRNEVVIATFEKKPSTDDVKAVITDAYNDPGSKEPHAFEEAQVEKETCEKLQAKDEEALKELGYASWNTCRVPKSSDLD